MNNFSELIINFYLQQEFEMLPEILLSLGALFLIVEISFLRQLGVPRFSPNKSGLKHYFFTGQDQFSIVGRHALLILFGILMSSFYVMNLSNEVYGALSYSHTFVFDTDLFFIKLILIFIAVSCIFYIQFVADKTERGHLPESFVLLLLAFLALILMCYANNFLAFYLVMELQTLCFCVMAASYVRNIFSAEAGIKYFLSSAYMSLYYLLGVGFIYVCYGTVDFSLLKNLLTAHFSTDLNQIGIANFNVIDALIVTFVTSTLLFKMGIFPFHSWIPEAYEGSPKEFTFVFSALPKIPLTIFLIKWVHLFHNSVPSFNKYLLYLAVISVAVGTAHALGQQKLKKLLIYSGIANTGYILVAVGAATDESYAAALVFTLIYLATTFLVWALFLLLCSIANIDSNDDKNDPDHLLLISNNKRSSLENIAIGFCYLITFFSLAGMPPLTGFIGKLSVIFSVADAGYYSVVFVLLMVGAFSFFYYINLLKISFFEPIVKEKILDIKKQHLVFFFQKHDVLLVFVALNLAFLLLCIFDLPLIQSLGERVVTSILYLKG